MVSVEDENGQMVDTIKLSNNVAKMSTPGKHQVWRITDRKDGKSEGDYVTLSDEDPRKLDSLFMFDPNYTFLNKTVDDFEARPLLQDIFINGELVYDEPDLDDIRAARQRHLDKLWDEYKRDLNPEVYPVDLSQKCYDNKMKMIQQIHEKVRHLH